MKAKFGKFGKLNFLPTQIACSVRRAVLTGHLALKALEHLAARGGAPRPIGTRGSCSVSSAPAWAVPVYLLGCTGL